MMHSLDLADYISSAGFILIESSYLPQIGRLYRVKEAHEFHILYPLLNTMGRFLGLAGGIMMHKPSITTGFALGIVVRLVLLSQVFYYRRREERNRRLELESVSL